MAEAGTSGEAARQLVEYMEEGKRVLGLVPTTCRVVAERFFDESGGMQLVIHAPFGSRINRAWGMALRKRICRTFDMELQASATDDGINLSLGPQLSLPAVGCIQLCLVPQRRRGPDPGRSAVPLVRDPLAVERDPGPGRAPPQWRAEGPSTAPEDEV